MTINVKQVESDKAAKAEGFADFNRCPHVLVESFLNNWTISVKTKDGQLVTFAFVETGTPGGCVDIHWANNPVTVKGANGDDRPVQPVILFNKNITAFHCAENVDKPVTLLTLVMDGMFDEQLKGAK